MSTISLLTSILQDYQSSASSSSAATSGTDAGTASTNTGTTANNYGAAYVLDLSQAAQDILNQDNSSGTPGTISLSDAQKQKLQTILDKYKDAPVNSDTLDALNTDLQQAGLAPDELAVIQQAKDFDPSTYIQKLLGFGDPTDSSSPTENVLSGLGSSASNTPIGDLLQQYASVAQSSHT